MIFWMYLVKILNSLSLTFKNVITKNLIFLAALLRYD